MMIVYSVSPAGDPVMVEQVPVDSKEPVQLLQSDVQTTGEPAEDLQTPEKWTGEFDGSDDQCEKNYNMVTHKEI